jgi:hypothetical protein
MKIKFLALFIFLVLAVVMFQATALAENANNGSNTPTKGELFAVVGILVLFAGVPLILNMVLAHRHLTRMHQTIEKFVDKHSEKIEEDKLVQIIQECIKADPSGAPGTARGTMALTILLIVGICLFFLLTL